MNEKQTHEELQRIEVRSKTIVLLDGYRMYYAAKLVTCVNPHDLFVSRWTSSAGYAKPVDEEILKSVISFHNRIKSDGDVFRIDGRNLQLRQPHFRAENLRSWKVGWR